MDILLSNAKFMCCIFVNYWNSMSFYKIISLVSIIKCTWFFIDLENLYVFLIYFHQCIFIVAFLTFMLNIDVKLVMYLFQCILWECQQHYRFIDYSMRFMWEILKTNCHILMLCISLILILLGNIYRNEFFL